MGRPRGRNRGETEEANDLAALMQEQLRQARMPVRKLCESFKKAQFTRRKSIPSEATVHRRLSGKDLFNEPELIEAIIAICTRDHDRKRVRIEVTRLYNKYRHDPTPIKVGAGPAEEVAALRAALARVRQRLLSTQEEVLVERKLRADAVEQAGRNAVTITSLVTLLGARTASRTASAAEMADLERALRNAEQERDNARRALDRAWDRIRQLEKPVALPAERIQPIRTTVVPGNTEVEALERKFRELDPDGGRFATALRRAFDTQLDGAHTGRFRWDQLSRHEKTWVGSQVMVELRREFRIEEGERLDFRIDGIEFDCQYSAVMGGWMIPPELVPGICLVVWANDVASRWSAGLVAVTPDRLSPSRNRDAKARLNDLGREAIRWLYRDAGLPENLLANLADEVVTAIVAPRTGAGRVRELLRRAQRRLISRVVVDTVALQEDGAKRIRDVRDSLAEEGILILRGSPADQEIARSLQLVVPRNRDELVTARVVPFDDHEQDVPSFEVEGERWVLAEAGDPVVRAPRLP